MYLPDKLGTILDMVVTQKRATRDFWRDNIKDEERARRESYALWMAMDIRDAIANGSGFLFA